MPHTDSSTPSERMGLHPCRLPEARPHKRNPGRSGDLWACDCGKVYVRRSLEWSNWAGAGTDWSWDPTILRVDAGGAE